MRDCPNCSQPIQDEAVYCRHCHTELEPPLWLTSMRRCPYCAEWIENDLEQCRYCNRNLFAAGSQHAAPFVESSATPEDLTQSLRDNLLDDDSGEAAAIAAAAAEFVADDPNVPLAGFDSGGTGELDESVSYEAPVTDPEPTFAEQPQSDLRRSLYEEDEEAEESSLYYGVGDESTEYVEPPAAASDSGIWMAEATEEEQQGTGPLSLDSDEYGRAAAGTEGVSELRADVSGPPGRMRRIAGRVARVVIFIAMLGAVIWALYALYQGPFGAAISSALATDIPTITPIPSPTSTRRPAPTLPPVTEEPEQGPVVVPTTEDGTPLIEPDPETGCVPWEAITLDNEGEEACVYGVIKRWWAGDEIPFIAIFSEEEGTFAIIDRSTRYPVGPGNCIMATGTIEVMGGTRPNIDAQGALEDCPESIPEE